MLEQLKKIGDYFPYCLTIVDVDDEENRPCLYTNQMFCENTGYDPEEAIGRNLSYLQGDLTPPDTKEFMKKCFKEKVSCIQDMVNYKKDGTPFLNRLLMLPLVDGDKTFYVGFQNDITEKKGLSYDNKSLQKVNEAEIRHMVNNPMTIILGSFALKLKNETDQTVIEELIKKLSAYFEQINSYALNIEDVSNFENFDDHNPDAKKLLD